MKDRERQNLLIRSLAGTIDLALVSVFIFGCSQPGCSADNSGKEHSSTKYSSTAYSGGPEPVRTPVGTKRDTSRMARIDAGPTANHSNSPPQKTTSRFVKAVDALKNLQPDKAIASLAPLLVHAAKRENKNISNRKLTARYLVWIAHAFAFDENIPAAAQALYIAHQLDPDDKLTTVALADSWEKIGRDADAQRLFNQALKFSSHFPPAARVLVRLYLAGGATERAKEMLGRIEKADDDIPERTQLLYAKLDSGLGFTKKAATEMAAAADLCEPYSQHLLRATSHKWLEQPEKQEEELAAAGKVFPNDPLWMTSYGALLCSQKREGEPFLEKSMGCRRFVSKAMFVYGSNMVGAKRIDEAMRCAQHMRMVAPWAEQTYILYGAVLSLQKRNDEAIRCYRDFVKLHPRSTTGYWLLADALNGENQHSEALSVLQTCTKLLPEFAGGWRRYGDALLAGGKWDEAKAAYIRASSLRPAPDSEGLNELSRHEIAITTAGLGSCLYHEGDLKGAAACAHIYNNHKFLPRLPWYLRLMTLRPGRVENSAVSQERDANEHTMLADMLMQTKRYNDCIKEYRAAVEINPNSVDLHCYLMNAYSEAGDFMGAAREDWETSSKMVAKIPAEIGKLGQQKKKNEPNKGQPNKGQPNKVEANKEDFDATPSAIPEPAH